MSTIKDIQAPILQDIEMFEKKFRESMKTKVVLLDTIMSYIVKRKGKQIRPMFVFLSAHVCGTVNEATYRGASLIELLHTATLVHDDVVDDANYRRGFFSINALWKNKIAVLVGDFLLSKGLLLSVDNNDFELLKIMSTAVKEMSEGELLQIEKARKLNITEEVYYDVIKGKTASLIAACCGAGASSVNSSPEVIKDMQVFGEKVGMAFQIKDDLFDYTSGDQIGKPVGIDIKEKKMTLPLIYALNNTDASTRRKMINIVKNESHKSKKVKEVIDFVINSGGIEYTNQKMIQYKNEAFEILQKFPTSVYKTSLEQLVTFTIEREK